MRLHSSLSYTDAAVEVPFPEEMSTSCYCASTAAAQRSWLLLYDQKTLPNVVSDKGAPHTNCAQIIIFTSSLHHCCCYYWTQCEDWQLSLALWSRHQGSTDPPSLLALNDLTSAMWLWKEVLTLITKTVQNIMKKSIGSEEQDLKDICPTARPFFTPVAWLHLSQGVGRQQKETIKRGEVENK